jgi:hypothetical protein
VEPNLLLSAMWLWLWEAIATKRGPLEAIDLPGPVVSIEGSMCSEPRTPSPVGELSSSVEKKVVDLEAATE